MEKKCQGAVSSKRFTEIVKWPSGQLIIKKKQKKQQKKQKKNKKKTGRNLSKLTLKKNYKHVS